MQHNIRVDVVYYLTPSDFEMEFNLCGCCHMRLLNEKTQDRQGFAKALAKAVSRSKVIIVCGPLFDENGLINTVSIAIGKKTEVINNSDYGINFDDEISIIEGSTPLVTPDGFFGGCIIESGPQAIIVLSESKGVRKTIMNNLVHQYIYELSLLSEDALAHSESTEEKSEEAEDAVSEQEDTEAEETAEETAEILEYEDISSTSAPDEEETPETLAEETEADTEEEVEQETLEESEQSNAFFTLAEETADEVTEEEETSATFSPIEMYIDPQHISPKKVSDYAKNYVPSEKDSLFISSDEYDYDIDDDDADFLPLPKMKFSIILITILLCLIAVVLLYLMVYIPYSKGIDYSVYMQQIFGPTSNL